MARSQESLKISDGWEEITNDDVVAIYFQVLSGRVEIRRGTTTAPLQSERGWIYTAGEGERASSLDTIANGSGSRLWARAANRSNATVLVDHA